ncbi:MAG: YiiX/YebB-like N1pC/P60 family cysteine hydrolase [Aureliella sp.]
MHAFTRWIAASMFLFFVCTECSGQTYPDGTLVMSRLKGRFGNFLSRVTGTHYTHTAIVVDGKVCESTFPRAKCTPINRYAAGKPWIVRYVPPTEALTPGQVQGIRDYANRNVGRRYGLKQFFNPNASPDGRIYCSQFVHKALTSAGIPLPARSWHTPDRLLHGSPIHQ